MSTVNQDDLKAIKVQKFAGKENEWDRLSEKFIALARARGFAGILLGIRKDKITSHEYWSHKLSRSILVALDG